MSSSVFTSALISIDWCIVGTVEHTPAEEPAAPDYKVVVALCAAVSLICSIDRASISVAIVPMAEQYGWSDSVKGAISSSFFLGYTITNLIGIIVDSLSEHFSLLSISHCSTCKPGCSNLHEAHETLQEAIHPASSFSISISPMEVSLMQAGMWLQSTLPRWYWVGEWSYGPFSQSSPPQQRTWVSCWCPCYFPEASWELAKE